MDNSQMVLNEIVLSNQLNPSKAAVPKGAKFIAGIGYFFSALVFFIGVLILAIGIIISLGISSLGSSSILNQFSGLLFNVIKDFSIVVGIMLIIVSVITFIISLFLWKGGNWARWIVIIFSTIIFIVSLVLILSGSYDNFFYLTGFLFNFLISLYLLFSKKVKEAFTRKPLP